MKSTDDIWAENAGPAASSGDILIASVSNYDESRGGSTLVLPGSTTATSKRYKQISGLTVDSGDRVLVARISGTYLIIGKIT